MEPKEAQTLYEHPANQLIAQVQTEHIEQLSKSISRIEKGGAGDVRAKCPLYEKLLTLPGVGRILGMTITMEVGDIKRFKTDGRLCQLLPHGGCPADVQQQEEERRTIRNAATNIGLGVCGSGQFRPALRRAVPALV